MPRSDKNNTGRNATDMSREQYTQTWTVLKMQKQQDKGPCKKLTKTT